MEEPIVIHATESMLNSPNSLCPLSIALRGESWAIYEAFLNSVSTQNGFEGTNKSIMHDYYHGVVEKTLMSCDAKAGQLIYGVHKANTKDNWCMWGCKVDKMRYEDVGLSQLKV